MTNESRGIALVSQARRELAEAKTIDETRLIMDKATLAKVLARKAHLGLEVQNEAADVKIRAERLAAQLLKEGQKNGTIASGGRPKNDTTMVSLSDLGITPNESSRWQQIAKIPDELFEAEIKETKESGEELTSAGLRRFAKVLDLETSSNEVGRVNIKSNNEWWTPAKYIKSARVVMGGIDCDPASSPAANLRVGATWFYSLEDDGLLQKWVGSVWLNPPYGGQQAQFASCLINQYMLGSVEQAILLVNANATDTKWFNPLWDYLLCFTNHRINFHSPIGVGEGSTHGSVFIYMGPNSVKFISEFKKYGALVRKVDDHKKY